MVANVFDGVTCYYDPFWRDRDDGNGYIYCEACGIIVRGGEFE